MHVTETVLRELTRGLSEYDADTLRYLAAVGVTETMLRRVVQFEGPKGVTLR